MDFDLVGNKELYLPVSGDRYLLIGIDFPEQNEQNEFEVQEG